MSINEKSYAYGASKSSIREIFAYGMARKAEVGEENVFDFSLGNPSIPAPDEVRQSIERSLELPPVQLHGYTPANGIPAVRQAVAASLTRRFQAECGDAPVAEADDLYLTCGAAASLSISFNALVNPGDEIIVIAPYFPEYRVWIETSGATCVEVLADQKTFQIDTEAVRAAINEHTKAVVINSPNNPVGAVYTRANLEALAAVLNERSAEFGTPVYLISDEPYRAFAFDCAEVPAVLPLSRWSCVLGSFSKTLSLAGERIGYFVANPEMPDHETLTAAVTLTNRTLGYVNAPVIGQRLAASLLKETVDLEIYDRRRKLMAKVLSDAGVEFEMPKGAFYFFAKSPVPDDAKFVDALLKERILVVPGRGFGFAGYVRLSCSVDEKIIARSADGFKRAVAALRA